MTIFLSDALLYDSDGTTNKSNKYKYFIYLFIFSVLVFG